MHTTVLPNGLRVAVIEDHRFPVVSYRLIYNVGSVDEEPHEAGYAHLLEHLMFESNKHQPVGQFVEKLQSIGGRFNASTNYLVTDYYATFPSRYWRSVLTLEAQRQQAPAISQENLKNQIGTVLDEKLLRVDNMPYVPALAQLSETLFAKTPYAHPVIGYNHTLQAATPNSVRAFYKRNYGPNRAILVIGGDVHTEEVLQAIKELFGEWQPVSPRTTHLPNLRTLFKKTRHYRITDARAPWPVFITANLLSEHPTEAFLQQKLIGVLNRTTAGLNKDVSIRDTTYLVINYFLFQKPVRIKLQAAAPRAHIDYATFQQTVANWQNRLLHYIETHPQWLCAFKNHQKVAVAQLLDDIENLTYYTATSWYRYNDPIYWWTLNAAFMALTPKTAKNLLNKAFAQPGIHIEIYPKRWHLRMLKKLLEWLPQSLTEEVESWVL